ncbi:hypothetical protein ACFQ6V_24015 [Streptomyces roseifaciens]
MERRQGDKTAVLPDDTRRCAMFAMTEATAVPSSSDGAGVGMLLYTGGEWTRVPDPFREAPDWFTAVKEAGYSEFFASGDDVTNTLAIKVYTGRTDYLVEVASIAGCEVVFAATLPDVMDLLAKWIPVVNAVTLGNLLSALDSVNPSLSDLIRGALRK